MRPSSVYRLVPCIVREHVRGGACACTQAPRDASTDLRLLPPRIHHHPADLYISRRVSHFRHYHSRRGCANPWARKRESALGFPPRSFRARWSRANTDSLSSRFLSTIFHERRKRVVRCIRVEVSQCAVSKEIGFTDESNAGIGPRVLSFHLIFSRYFVFVGCRERGGEKERERVSIAIEVFFSFLFVFFYPRAARVSWEMCATCSEPASSPATPTEWD